MQRHYFHPIHAVVAIMVVVIGVITATFGVNWLADNKVAAGSAAIALVGVALLPWPQRSRNRQTGTN